MQSYQFSLRNLVRFVLNRGNRESLTVNMSMAVRQSLFANKIGRKETPLSCARGPHRFETQDQIFVYRLRNSDYTYTMQNLILVSFFQVYLDLILQMFLLISKK